LATVEGCHDTLSTALAVTLDRHDDGVGAVADRFVHDVDSPAGTQLRDQPRQPSQPTTSQFTALPDDFDDERIGHGDHHFSVARLLALHNERPTPASGLVSACATSAGAHDATAVCRRVYASARWGNLYG
jgi:hypothetical protein